MSVAWYEFDIIYSQFIKLPGKSWHGPYEHLSRRHLWCIQNHTDCPLQGVKPQNNEFCNILPSRMCFENSSPNLVEFETSIDLSQDLQKHTVMHPDSLFRQRSIKESQAIWVVPNILALRYASGQVTDAQEIKHLSCKTGYNSVFLI